MKTPQKPPDEFARQAALNALQVLDTPAEERFDRIVRLAARFLNVPIALVSLIDDDRQWFKSCLGLSAAETSREISFCGHAILRAGPFIVADARLDERFADNPLVVGDPNIRFYAGQPIHTRDGHPIGTLCVIDNDPRVFGTEDQLTLRDLAALVEAELDLQRLSKAQRDLVAELDETRRRAAIDSLTRAWNRDAIFDVLGREFENARLGGQKITVAMMDTDRFKAVNDQYGHPVGDEVLRQVADRIRASLRPYDAVGRYGGEEFLVVMVGCEELEAAVVAERIRASVGGLPTVTNGGEIAVTISIGVVTCDGSSDSPATVVKAADAALYRAKANGRDQVAVGTRP